MAWIFDAVVFFLILGMTYALSSEGLWGAALMFFNTLFASMITLNFYEPLAQIIASNLDFLSGYADALCILVIFTVSLLILRLTTENLAPAMVRYPMPLYHAGRFVFAVLGSAVTMGMLLIALDASPVNKKILGSMDYKSVPFFKLRLDKEMLAFFQWSTGYVFTRNGPPDPYKEFGNGSAPSTRRRTGSSEPQKARPYPKGERPLRRRRPARPRRAAPAEGGRPRPPGAAPGRDEGGRHARRDRPPVASARRSSS